MAFEHRPWSTFSDGAKIEAYNPLRRVPTLVLDEGAVLIESGAILDYLDEQMGPERALIPAHGPARREAMKVCSLATGMADKAVALVYEKVLHEQPSAVWAERCAHQIGGVLRVLEADRGARTTPFWFGPRIGHADIAVACALRFVSEAHPEAYTADAWPALAAHAALCEALAPFREICQPLSLPKR
jgi:glutathione S-transferase